MPRPRMYSQAQRDAAIQDWINSGKLLREIAVERAIPASTIAFWIYWARLNGDTRLPMLASEQLGERRHRSRRAR